MEKKEKHIFFFYLQARNFRFALIIGSLEKRDFFNQNLARARKD